MRSLAVSFTRISAPTGRVRRYPILPVVLTLGGVQHRVDMLLDSGADYSFLPRGIVQGVFGMHPEDLPSGENHQGLGGLFRTGVTEGTIRFGTTREPFEETLPFFVSRDASVEPGVAVLGREPFFDRFRVDFRMGYRKRGIEGKYVLYRD